MNDRVGSVLRSKRGSVRMYEGSFYSQGWVEVYIPLDIAEAQAYCNEVSRLEDFNGRMLTVQELMSIEVEVERAY